MISCYEAVFFGCGLTSQQIFKNTINPIASGFPPTYKW